MKVIAYTRPDDGGVSIVFPCLPRSALDRDETYLARVAAKCVPHGVEWSVIEAADLPKDRKARNAWRLDRSTKKITTREIE